jgi:hypothetical protein
MSPVMIASWSLRPTRTEKWSMVWPGVGMKCMWSSTTWSLRTMSQRPACTIGSTESLIQGTASGSAA